MNQFITTQASDYTGISANHALVCTAHATDGSWIEGLRFKASGVSGDNVAAAARIYINNGSAQTTATNNTFWGEVSLPITTPNAAKAGPEVYVPMKFFLQPGFRIYFGLERTVASGWNCNAVLADF